MSQVQNIPYAELEVGQKAEYTSSIAERDLQLFAAVSGDRNPVYLDAAYAATTQFKERIAHGMLSGALISAAIATVLPGQAPSISARPCASPVRSSSATT